MNSTRQQARKAGWLYFLTLLTGPIGLIYVPSKLIVSGDATATADRIRAGESLLRLGIASELYSQVIFVFVVLALYRLFKGSNPSLARQMLVLGALVEAPIVFLNVLNEFAALILVHGAPFLAPFNRPQLDSLAYLFLRLHGQGFVVASIFWGLWLFPFGMLVIRSGFIPRILGVLVMIAGFGYLASSFAAILLPRYADVVDAYARILSIGELPIIFWLALWGAKGPLVEAPVS